MVAEGISTYHVDSDGMVFRHVVDNKMEDRDKATSVNKVEEIKEKLKKLQKSPETAPSM